MMPFFGASWLQLREDGSYVEDVAAPTWCYHVVGLLYTKPVVVPLMVLLLGLLAGCSTTLVKVAEPRTVLVTWDRSQPTECGIPGKYLGCAYRMPEYVSCTIQMPEDAPDWVVAEEFRHCFGFEHP